MNSVLAAAFGWLVPGGAYLLKRRYLQFAGFALIVSISCIGGILLGGSSRWPEPAELDGLDPFTALMFRAGALARLLAGGPYLLSRLFAGPSFLEGRLQEYGTTLLMMAGIFNLLAVSSAFDLPKGDKH
jgi:uncharacterized protein DUF6677